MLSNMRTDMSQTDGSHLTSSLQRDRMQKLDLGPNTEIVEERRIRREYDPTHPHANPEGYVEYPDINVVEEMARMVSANRIYEANLSSVQSAKEIIKRTLEI